MTIVLDDVDDFERHPLADDVACSPSRDRLFTPVVLKLVIDERVIDECRQQGVEITCVCRLDISGYRRRKSRSEIAGRLAFDGVLQFESGLVRHGITSLNA